MLVSGDNFAVTSNKNIANNFNSALLGQTDVIESLPYLVDKENRKRLVDATPKKIILIFVCPFYPLL